MEKRLKNSILNVLLVIFILIFIGAAVSIGVYYARIRKGEEGFKAVRSLAGSGVERDPEPEKDYGDKASGTDAEQYRMTEVKGKKVQEKFADLYRENGDFTGWLRIPDTGIDYPVMLTPGNEEFYLHRDFEKAYSYPGTLFLDTKSDPGKGPVLIYGHNMKAGTMFHSLLSYEREDFYRKHRYFTFDTLQEDGTFEVVAAFRTDAKTEDSFPYGDFFALNTRDAFDEFLDACRKRTPYTTEAEPAFGSRLLMLSTCAYHTEEGRYVVIAVQAGE